MQYILNETEFQAFQTLKEENAKLSHKLAVANEVREKDRAQINKLSTIIAQREESLKSAYMETFRIRTNSDSEISRLKSQITEMKRDIDGTSARLSATAKISAARLETMHHLQAENHRLKTEHVCIAQNPRTGTVRVVSVVKADDYRKFGWTVSEEYLVDRPA